MSRNGHITDAFWGEDFNSKDGYRAVNKRMLEGIETCKMLVSIVRQRAKNEEEFSKSLQRNFKASDSSFSSEIGKLREALESFRLNGEKIAAEHQSASKELLDCAERIQKYSDKLKVEWLVEKEKAKKIIQEKQRLYDKAMNAKRAYHDKSKEAEHAELKVRITVGGNPSAVEKALKTRDKGKQDADRADQAYREAVRQLDETRDQWEKDLYRYYEFCEEHDKERIKTLQNELWVLSNISSVTYVAADQCCEDVRCALENVVPEVDIREFVEKNQTGTRKPASVPFDPYQSILEAGQQQQRTSGGHPQVPNGTSPHVRPTPGPRPALGQRN